MFYEIREYTTVPGRMTALIKRNNEVVLPLFTKHDMNLVFMSVTELGENSNNELVYMLQWETYAEMAQKWAAYMSDPEWIEAKAASEADGPILERIRRRIVNPTPFG
ncbi:NIPSNAP family protein [Actinocrinis sp.]|uniref:NIPSNAP family protein n=1 Tax=Actinocrinis sp. TaxID=1920516 RepID=UPI002D6DF126|nr:NIPSNAP family protein [Actinocrinis sp.]HZP54473.1 NIPSNAP family protein [Actinocrinis sp.]